MKARVCGDSLDRSHQAIRGGLPSVGTAEIATRFGMSRMPVHEAAVHLREEDIVRVLARKGI